MLVVDIGILQFKMLNFCFVAFNIFGNSCIEFRCKFHRSFLMLRSEFYLPFGVAV